MQGKPLIPVLVGRALCGAVIAFGVAACAATGVWAQTRTATEMEEQIMRLLKVEEFKQERTEIVALGPAALPVLLRIFTTTGDDEAQVRVMSVLRDIAGDKQPFFPKVVELAKGGAPAVQTAALVLLEAIGTAAHATALEEIVASDRQREAARIVAARALAKVGTRQSIAVVETALQRERTKTQNRQLVNALQTGLDTLRRRYGQRP